MRWHLAVVIVLGACATTAPETLHRPGQRPEPLEAARATPHLPALVTLPPSLALILDEVQPGELSPAMRRLLPPRPFVVGPGRPPAGGDALALAHRALHQGDARDAITQLLPIAASADHDVATYARWRLAQAYLEVGEVVQGEALLREVAASHRPEAWAALVLLAESIAARDGAVAAVRRLEPLVARAQGTYDELERAVLTIGPAMPRASLLLERAARIASFDDPQTCACALAAVVLQRARAVTPITWRCVDLLERDKLSAEVTAAFTTTLRASYPVRAIADAALRWREFDDGTASSTVGSWIAMSATLRDVTSDPTSPLWLPARRGAIDALANAALRAVAGQRVSRDELQRAYELREHIASADRARVYAIVDVLAAHTQN